jgi:hypothetical protein
MVIQLLHSLEFIINHGVLNLSIYKLNKLYYMVLVHYITILKHPLKVSYQPFQLFNNFNKNIHGNHLLNLSGPLM